MAAQDVIAGAAVNYVVVAVAGNRVGVGGPGYILNIREGIAYAVPVVAGGSGTKGDRHACHCLAVIDRVDPITAIEVIISRTADQRVVSGIAVNVVIAPLAVDRVGQVGAVQRVAIVGVDHVLVALSQVPYRAVVERDLLDIVVDQAGAAAVVAGDADLVVRSVLDHQVADAARPHQHVGRVNPVQHDRVGAFARVLDDRVVIARHAVTGRKDIAIVASPAGEIIRAMAADQSVIAPISVNFIIAVRSLDDIPPGIKPSQGFRVVRPC